MKTFFKHLWEDPSNKIVFVVLGLFLLLGIYFSYKDIGGFQDNQIWVYTVIVVAIFWFIANIIDFFKIK